MYSQSELTGLTECDVSICDASDDDFFPDEEWPISEHIVLPKMAADNANRTVRNRNNNRGRWSWPGSENDIASDENSNQVDRPVTKLATAGAGIKNDSFSVEHVKCGVIPVTKLIPVRVLDTEEPLIMRVSTITPELSVVETSAYSETDINYIPVIKECVSLERRRREQLSAYANTQLVRSNYRRGVTDCCFGVCGMTDSLNRSEIGWCWNCVDWLLWGYCVSCLVTIVIKDRSFKRYRYSVDYVVFPVEEVDKLSVIPRAQRAAQYMTAMVLRGALRQVRVLPGRCRPRPVLPV